MQSPRRVVGSVMDSLPGGRVDIALRTTGAHSKPMQYAIKRSCDYMVAAALLIMLSPLMLVVALLVKATSPGPVLYAGPRVGRDCRQFACLKFRTMCEDAEQLQPAIEHRNQAAGPLFKIRCDPRTTTVGHWMRITCVDELPQLINVLLGQMSLVGPRPLPLRDAELLPAEAARRHEVLPGITGQWQVVPNHHDADVDIVAIDIDYVERWSLVRDARIIWQTAHLLVTAARNLRNGRAARLSKT